MVFGRNTVGALCNDFTQPKIFDIWDLDSIVPHKIVCKSRSHGSHRLGYNKGIIIGTTLHTRADAELNYHCNGLSDSRHFESDNIDNTKWWFLF